MIGYVQNISSIWAHALKRAVRPSGKIELDELYNQYGVKHGMEENQEFVDWLSNVKLTDRSRWKIVYDDGTKEAEAVTITEQPSDEVKKGGSGYTTTIVPTEMTVANVVELSVRKARETLPKITDLKLLQYALQQANSLAGKDSLCRIIRKRISELKIAR